MKKIGIGLLLVMAFGFIFLLQSPQYKKIAPTKDTSSELFVATSKLMEMVANQPKALSMCLETARETLYSYEPQEQHSLVLKYLNKIKALRLQNQAWVEVYKEQLSFVPSKESSENPKILNDLRKLSKPLDLVAFVNKNKSVDLGFNLRKIHDELTRSSVILARYDSEFENELDQVLKKLSKTSSLWQRIKDNVQAFFYKALPPEIMDTEMIDKANNDL